MPIRIRVDYVTPLTDDDVTLLKGLAVLGVSLATIVSGEMPEQEPAQPACGEPSVTGLSFCPLPKGHDGDHLHLAVN